MQTLLRPGTPLKIPRPPAWLLKFRAPGRRELRLALLAAMETCWVHATLAFFGSVVGNPRPVSPLSLFAAYWIALTAGRVLPRLNLRWQLLQLMAIGITLVTALLVVRLDVYGARGSPWDGTWFSDYARSLFSFREGTGGLLATLGVLYVFVRGLGLGPRPLTLWFVGFQFRLGIVAFFLLLLLGSLVKRLDLSPWIFVYFSLALLAVALARLDEMGSTLRLGPRWLGTLLGAVGLVLVLGVALLQILTLDSAGAVLQLFAPLVGLFGLLVLVILVPLSVVVQWLGELLRPLFQNLQSLRVLGDLFSSFMQNVAPPRPDLAPTWLGPLVQAAFVLTLVLGIGLLLARALNRRMNAIEEELYVREALGEDDEMARAERERKKKTASRRRMGAIAAESIRRIYAALVARAADAGVTRQAAETPYEFLPRLERTWPDERTQIRTITEAYVAVHYGEQVATSDQVDRVRSAWREVENRMKRRGKT